MGPTFVSFDSKFMVMGLISAGEGEGVTSVFIYVHEYSQVPNNRPPRLLIF